MTTSTPEVMEEVSQWEEGKSSQIERFHYNPRLQSLQIQFKGGATYLYEGVSQEVVDGFRSAESRGTYFGKHIKSAFKYQKISDALPAEIEPVKIELSKLEKEVQGIVEYAKALPITCKAEAEIAVGFIRQRKSVLDAFVEWFSPIKKASWDAHKKNTEKEKSIIDPNQAAINIVKEKLKAFDEEQERLAREERERIRREEEAKERARREKEEAERKERQRIEDEARAKEEARLKAEREKFEAEKKAQADALAEAGKAAEAERIRREAAAKAELDAIMSENRRLREEAERLEAEKKALEALEAPIDVYVAETPREEVAGVSMAYPWKAEVVDIRALCRGIAEGKTPPDVIKIQQSKLDALAKTWKDRTGEHHPGVRGYEDKSVRIK